MKNEQHRMVPLKALEAERAKYKKKLNNPEIQTGQVIINKLKELTNMEASELIDALNNATTTETKENGLAIDKNINSNNIVDEIEEKDFLTEFAWLMKNPIYSDAGDYIDEIREYATTNKCSLKTAYNSLYAERKYEEIKQKAQKDAINDNIYKKAHKIPATASGNTTASDERVKLDKDHLAVAEKYGMTTEEYMKYM